ncbi:hypothetical protein, partial [Myxococcus sp. RHSTA-1-4]|uniref:hypothetical protein n=1 Tax=Myxococcus sp. RHSTA-1-4 TaxID=2874601 RepID=UPI001CBBDFF4
VLTFPVSRGEQVSIAVTALTLGGASSASLRVYDPAGVMINNHFFSTPGAFDVAVAPKDGVYTAVLKPGSSATGFSASLSLVRAVSGPVVVDGPQVSFSNVAGQNGRYTFAGTAGDRLGLGVASVSTTPTGQSVLVTVLNPDGSSLINCGGYNVPGNCNLPVVPVTGTYTIVVDPQGLTVASVGLRLSRTVEGSLEVGGPTVTFSTDRVGQDGRYTFTAAAGANLALVLSAGTFTNYATVRVYKPDGTQQTSTYGYPNQTAVLDFTAATAGTYSITVDPYLANTGQLTLGLVQEVAGSAGDIDGAAVVASLEVGQNGRYTFAGTAGDRLGVGVTSVSTTPTGQSVTISVLKPDGSTLVTCGSYSAPGNCNLSELPATGTYTLFLDPAGTASASVGLLLSRTVEGSLEVGGPTVTFSTGRVGQDGRYTFTATAGANLALVTSAGTFTNYATVRVYKPDGTQQTSTYGYPNQTAVLDFTAATAGTYSITVDPYLANTGQLTLGLVQEVAGGVELDGTATVVGMEVGQNGRYTFAGTAGDRLGLGVTSVS